MKFSEAAEIARIIQGSTLTRDDSGEFIVRCEDGSVVGTATQPAVPGSYNLLEVENANLRRKCEVLEDIIRRKSTEFDARSREMEQLRGEIVSLQFMVSKVSNAEWERIKEEDWQEHTELKRAERERIMKGVRDQTLSREGLIVVVYAANKFGFTKDEMTEIYKELDRKPRHVISTDPFVVYSPTDGQ